MRSGVLVPRRHHHYRASFDSIQPSLSFKPGGSPPHPARYTIKNKTNTPPSLLAVVNFCCGKTEGIPVARASVPASRSILAKRRLASTLALPVCFPQQELVRPVFHTLPRESDTARPLRYLLKPTDSIICARPSQETHSPSCPAPYEAGRCGFGLVCPKKVLTISLLLQLGGTRSSSSAHARKRVPPTSLSEFAHPRLHEGRSNVSPRRLFSRDSRPVVKRRCPRVGVDLPVRFLNAKRRAARCRPVSARFFASFRSSP